MSTKDKLLQRLLTRPKDFTVNELDTLLQAHNCIKLNSGKTSGSKIQYTHVPTGRDLCIHSPHPGKELKPYVISLVIKFLEETGELQ